MFEGALSVFMSVGASHVVYLWNSYYLTQFRVYEVIALAVHLLEKTHTCTINGFLRVKVVKT